MAILAGSPLLKHSFAITEVLVVLIVLNLPNKLT